MKHTLPVLLLALVAAPAFADPPEISWFTVDGGGGTSTDGTIFLSGTIGQADAGRLTGSPFISVYGGYWGAASGAPTCPADFNDDGFVDDTDFVIFASAYDILECSSPLMPLDCPSDLNDDTLVDDSDFVIFVAAYNELLCP
ncbi:MAG: hypothetical protein K2Y21_03985 [Phycisphaerales bacterium]|nr:hypothetical protein [Phycisphaerales bacterium]